MKKLIIYVFVLILFIFATVCRAGIYYTSADTTVYAPDSLEGTNYYNIDLNGDEVIDFRIGAQFYLSYEGYHPPYETYMIVADSTGLNQISFGPYYDGDTIHQNLSYMYGDILFGYFPGNGYIGWWSLEMADGPAYAYLGLSLLHQGNTYYGWIRLKADRDAFYVTGYAWHNEPDMPIIAGQTE